MKTLLLAFILVLFALIANSQNCKMFFPSKEGTVLTLTHYDSKQKVTGTVKEKITGKESTSTGVKINFESESFDKNGKSVSKGNYSVTCENGVFYFEMNNYMSNESMGNAKNMKVEVVADKLDMPSNPTVGQTLKDGTLTMNMKNEAGMQIMSMKTTVKNRKIEGIETITTPAGTFECYKISSDIESKMMFNVQSKSVEWFAKDIGMVKSETYDSKGKLMGSTVLTAIN